MTQLKPFSGFEAQMSGAFGDFYIGHAAAVTTKKFSHIVVGESGATLTDVKIRGVSVKAARAYPNVMPAGYPMCAGGNDYFDSIELSAGDAQGFFFEEPVTPVASAVAVENGVAEAAMAPVITFDNAGLSGSKDIRYRLKDSDGEIVSSGTRTIYFLNGEDVTVIIPGLTYPETIAEDYTFEINLGDGEAWVAGAAFDVTAE